MINKYKIGFIFLVAVILCFSLGAPVFAQSVGGVTVQTNSAVNISNYQAVLNGYLYMPYISGSNYVYFQWGTTTNYGFQTVQQYLSNAGSFSQTITGLTYNSTYHYRAVAQGTFGTIYGQDMTFSTGQSGFSNLTANAGQDLYLVPGQTTILQGSAYGQNGYNLNYSWLCNGGSLSSYNIAQPTFTAPYVTGAMSYVCTLTISDNYGNSNSDSMTVFVNYNGIGATSVQTGFASYYSNSEVALNGVLSGTNTSAINYVYFQWGSTTSYGNETMHQAVGYSQQFTQYLSNLNPGTTYHFRAVAQGNYGTIYGQDLTFTTSGVSNNPPVVVTYIPPTTYNGGGQVLGASTVSTGLTNNFLADSFFLPLLLIIAGLWLYFSGTLYTVVDKIKAKIKR